MADLDGVYGDPNGGAYEKTEVRTGPPLSYVSEKLRRALEEIHMGHWEFVTYQSNHTLPSEPDRARPGPEDVRRRLQAAFRVAAVAFCALSNALAHANPADFYERLLALRRDDFSDWLDEIERGGTVSDE
jgi:hypothetical protein